MHEVLEKPSKSLLSLEHSPSALLLQGTRLYVGNAQGRLSCYLVSQDQQSATLQEQSTDGPTHGKSIDQLGFIKELSSLVVLSGGNVFLLDSHTFELQLDLSAHCKSQANLFSAYSYVKPAAALGEPAAMMTSVAIAARRRLILLRWHDAQWLPPTDVALPHQARSLAYMTPSTLVFGFSDGSYAKLALRDYNNLHLAELPISDLFNKKHASAASAAAAASHAGSTGGLGSFGGLALKTGGYMGLGGRVAKNDVLSAAKGDLLAVKEAQGVLLASHGPARECHFDHDPDHIMMAPPYVIAALPSPAEAAPSQIRVYSSTSMQLLQSLPVSQSDAALKLLTSASPAKLPIIAAAGNDVYLYSMVSYPKQITSLLSSGQYGTALTLINNIEEPILQDRDAHLRTVRSLVALKELELGHEDKAIDAFIELDVNPAKVVGLWDEEISGKLFLGDAAEETFGGRSKETVVESRIQKTPEQKPADEQAAEKDVPDTASLRSAMSALTSPRKKPSLPQQQAQHSRQASIASQHQTPSPAGEPTKQAEDAKTPQRRPVEVLLRYLADRRQKVNKALSLLDPTQRPSTSDTLPPATASELLSIPDGPLSELPPRQLHRVAQTVDTALFKCYLLVRPSLLGSLCRLDNWCEAEEVEELLMSAKRYSELLDLFSRKGLHHNAIELLKRVSEEDEDATPRERVQPAVSYLQKLGPQHFDLICHMSPWVFSQDPGSGLELFTADLEEVEALPRHRVMQHLEEVHNSSLQTYLEHIINTLGEQGPDFHEKLAELYLQAALDAPDTLDLHERFIDFLKTSQQYRPSQLVRHLPEGAMPEARAILLGRMDQYEKALQIYVYQMHEYRLAEDFCRAYKDKPELFELLLRLLLHPAKDGKKTREPLIQPALDLLSRQSRHLNPARVMDMLPPLLSLSDVRQYMISSTRRSAEDKVSSTFGRDVHKARLDQLKRATVMVQEQRIKLNDSSLCSSCHKRLGHSSIAIHQPLGQVTHARCQLDRR